MTTSHFNPNPSPLDALTDDQQRQLISWLESYPPSEVIKKVRRDPPEGFGLTTYATSLRRFYARYQLSTRPETVSLAHEFKAQQLDDQPVDDVTASATRQLAFEIANSPRAGINHFKTLSRWVLKQRELDQRQSELRLLADRFSFDREKWEYDISRQVLMHRNALDEIATNAGITDEEKINRARSILFNRPIHELPR